MAKKSAPEDTPDPLPSKISATPPLSDSPMTIESHPTPTRSIGRMLLTFVSISLLVAPLFSMGLILLAENNVNSYLYKQARNIVFHVTLRNSLGLAEARTLANSWKTGPDWARADVIPPTDALGQVEELKQWMSNDANRLMAESMPLIVGLHPSNPLGVGNNAPEKLLETILASPDTDQAFYDKESLFWLRGVHSNMTDLTYALCGLSLFFAFFSAFLVGWIHARVFHIASSTSLSPGMYLGGRWLLIITSSLSGPLALCFVACVTRIINIMSTINVEMISLFQMILIAVCGVFFSILAWIFHMLIDRHTRKKLLSNALLALVLFAIPIQNTSAQNLTSSTLPRSITPTPNLELDSRVGGMIPGYRQSPGKEAKDLIVEKDALIAYLQKYLTLTDEERQIELQNGEQKQRELAVAQKDLAVSQKALDKRMTTTQDLQKALQSLIIMGKQPHTFANTNSRTKRAIAQNFLTREAMQSFHLLDLDRQQVQEKQAINDRFAGQAGHFKFLTSQTLLSPDTIRKEVEKLQEEKHQLETGLSFKNSTPAFPALRPSLPPLPSIISTDKSFYLFLDPGTLIHAVEGGTVLQAGPYIGLGEIVAIRHSPSISSICAFLAPGEIAVQAGQVVKRGQTIGSAGTIRNFQGRGGIRFEVRRDGEITDLTALKGLTDINLHDRVLGKQTPPAPPR